MSNRHPNHEVVLAALREHSELVLSFVAEQIIALGALSEWSMDDNFAVTEGVAMMADRVGLPSAGDQTDDALRFYGAAALALGLDADFDPEGDDDSDSPFVNKD